MNKFSTQKISNVKKSSFNFNKFVFAIVAILSLLTSNSILAQCGSGFQNGGFLMNVTNQIYAVNIRTGKSTFVSTSPFATAAEGLNSFATNASTKLMYYANGVGAPANTALYAYNISTNTHVTISANVTAQGITLGTNGMGSGGGAFDGGFLYLAIEGVNTGSADPDTVIYRCTMSPDGLTLVSAVPVIQIDPGDSMGDFGIVGNLIVRAFGGSVIEYNVPGTYVAGVNTAPASTVTPGGGAAYISQVAQDYLNQFWVVADGFRQYFPATNTFSGTTINTTTDGVTNVASPADAGGCIPTDAVIGNLVFVDSNNNGVFDGTDYGAPGVTIDIYDDLNGNGVINAPNDILLTTVTTDASGLYNITNLLPGNYIIQVTDTGNVLSAAPSTTGGNLQTEALAISESNLTHDFGYFITDFDHDGIPDATDPNDTNPDICGDSDSDGCDDCSVGTDNFGPLSDSLPLNDGTDTDGDGLCDTGDTDDDNDGILDATDPNDTNPDICGDSAPRFRRSRPGSTTASPAPVTSSWAAPAMSWSPAWASRVTSAARSPRPWRPPAPTPSSSPPPR